MRKILLLFNISLLFCFSTSVFAQGSNCSVSNVQVTPVPGSPLEYNISFSLNFSTPMSGSLTILGLNPNGGNISNIPNFPVNVNHGAGTHNFSSKLIASSAVPIGTPVKLTFSLGRNCNQQVDVSFPPPIAECSKLRSLTMRCASGGKLRFSHLLEGVSGNGINGTIKVTGNNCSLSNPSVGGNVINPNTLGFNVGNPVGGNFFFDYVMTPASLTVTPSLLFEFNGSNNSLICASKVDLRPFSSYCDNANRCDSLNVSFSATNLANPTTVGGALTIGPASQANVTQVTISLVNAERRAECPNAPVSPWTSFYTPNSPILSPAGTNAGIQHLGNPSVVNTPHPNTLRFTNSSNAPQTILTADHLVQLRGVPEKANAACPERLRYTLRYVITTSSGCVVELYRIVEGTR